MLIFYCYRYIFGGGDKIFTAELGSNSNLTEVQSWTAMRS